MVGFSVKWVEFSANAVALIIEDEGTGSAFVDPDSWDDLRRVTRPSNFSSSFATLLFDTRLGRSSYPYDTKNEFLE